ncbi:MAG: T9SS type A sorting domain-containing protein, partial [Ignavibacterium sp.]
DTLGNIWSIGNVNIPYPANQEKEYLIIDINKELSEPWTIYENPPSLPIMGRWILDDTLIVFGEPRNVRTYQIYDDGFVFVNYLFAEGIGLISEIYDDNSESNLTYAKINGKEYGKLVSIDDYTNTELPIEFYVSQNYPNPFNGITNIQVELPQNQPPQEIHLLLYDVLGREVLKEKHFVNQRSIIQINTDLYNLPSGSYFYQVRTSTSEVTNKLAYLK